MIHNNYVNQAGQSTCMTSRYGNQKISRFCRKLGLILVNGPGTVSSDEVVSFKLYFGGPFSPSAFPA
jgi:hypothetical protein